MGITKMKLLVKVPFVGHGFNMPAPGTLIDVSEELAGHLLGLDVVDRYEMKIDTPPAEVKKKPEPSESSQADPAPRKRTRRRSKKSATKS